MIFSTVFKRFAEQSPIPVIARGLMERVLNPRQLDQWFEQNAEGNIPASFYSPPFLTS